jgi:prephenate dehydrogenase
LPSIQQRLPVLPFLSSFPSNTLEELDSPRARSARRAYQLMSEMLFERVAICGVGLIGGSLAMLARRHGLIGEIVGLGRSQLNLDVALERKLIDTATRDPVEAARGSDLVVLATPIMAMPATLKAMVDCLPPESVITDVGSVKGWVVRQLEPLLGPRMALVAAHPVAGKEVTGAGAADPELFKGRRTILTPSARSTPEAIAKIETMWGATGAVVEAMDPDVHDRLLALASHLPQLAASSLANAIAEQRVNGLLAANFGATGLRDATRLAMSSWEMWRDICLTNRDPIVESLRLMQSSIAEFEKLIAAGDAKGLEVIFERGRKMRQRLK